MWKIRCKWCYWLLCSHSFALWSGIPADVVPLKLGRKWSIWIKARWQEKIFPVTWICQCQSLRRWNDVTACYGLTPSSPGTPAGAPARRALDESPSVVYADGLDVVRQGGLGRQMQDRHIEPGVVAQSNICHIHCHLKGVGSILLQTTQNDLPLRRCGRRAGRLKRAGLGFDIMLNWIKQVWFMYHNEWTLTPFWSDKGRHEC